MTYRREVGLVAIRGDIDRDHPSLVAALERAGEDVGLAVGIAELFGGDVDFYRDLQPGDVIEVVFEQVLRDGARVGYGDIVAARLTNDGRLLSAFRFQPAGGKPAYYDAAGLSLKRFFLASPLKFEPRVTSGFSYRRLHPVLGIRRPHLGADFGAPKGAPVVAIADAAVVSARYTAGGGNTVTLRHAGGYESRYLHLSSFGAGRPGRGARVAGPGHRPRRRHRARHRRAPALRAAAQREARQSGRRAEAQPARGADRGRGSGRIRRASRRAGSAVRERRARSAGRRPPTDSDRTRRAGAIRWHDGTPPPAPMRGAPKEIACACTAV